LVWDQFDHAEDWLLFPENIGEYLSIDEVALTQFEVYTFITNKALKGKKGCLVGAFKGTNSKRIIPLIKALESNLRNKVKEVTLDMSTSMQSIIRETFTEATQVTDRFHVQQLADEATQKIRIEYRWKSQKEEDAIKQLAKDEGIKYSPQILENGETKKQVLARSRYLLHQPKGKWSTKQKSRAKVLFHHFPEIKESYDLSNRVRTIYNTHCGKEAKAKLMKWLDIVKISSSFEYFENAYLSICNNFSEILNYFNNRNTNASAESFNAKVRDFRRQFRGVRDEKFFLFRLTKLFA